MTKFLLQEYITLIVEKIRSRKNVKNLIDDKFYFGHFKTLNSIEMMYKYASTYLEQLGEGSSRAAFLLSSRYVLKIAINEYGLSQNEVEYTTSTSLSNSPLITKVYSADNQSRWIVTDLVKELTSEKEFENLTGTNWNEFVESLYRHLDDRGYYPKTDLIQPDKFTQEVISFCRQNNLVHDDICAIVHWGKTPDGRAVLLDFGLTYNILNQMM